jgi:Fur family ferric uptake transcriptional regulator
MKAKLTKNQQRVLDLLQELHKSLSAQDIYIALRDRRQSIGLATVYRALDAMKIQGRVKALTLPSGETVYGLTHSDRHHLNCVNCGASVPINDCPVHELEHQLDSEYDFKVYYHTLEFFGLCHECQQQQQD